ncbi:MAG: sensor histidine kinase [Endozoicomonas sp.]
MFDGAVSSFSLSARNLRRLCLIRLMLVLVEVLSTGYMVVFAGVSINTVAVLSVIVFQLLIVLTTMGRFVASVPSDVGQWVMQLSMDILGLSLFLYFFGGSTNPLVIYFLLPVVIASALLPVRQQWFITVQAILAYTLLMFYYHPVIDSESLMAGHEASSQLIGSHLQGMWLTFVITALMINTIVMKMARAIRQQKVVIADSRERQLRDEQIMAVATHAAATAHALGTPLTTMTVLIGEMQACSVSNKGLQQDLKLLAGQVGICKSRLRELVEHCSRSAGYQTAPIRADRLLEQVIEQWRLLRPQVVPGIEMQGTDAPEVLADPALTQALLNLLNNAADASPDNIELTLQWDRQHLLLQIRDRGEGFSIAEAEAVGTLFYTTKEEGMGLGLSLSQATVERLGGSVRLYQRESGGTITEVSIPVSGATDHETR